MFSFVKKYPKLSSALAFLLVVVGIAVARPANTKNTTNDMAFLLLIGLVLGALIAFLVIKLMGAKNQTIIKESTHTVVESMQKVFKIVSAEGHLNELYNFEETKKLFGFITSTKRALVIIEARVLMGYDFKKCTWEADEINQRIKLLDFPAPEILSIETDYKYYNFDEGIFNLLNRDDLTRIQVNGKRQVEAAALKSHLPKIAADQMRTILTEVVQSKHWQLEDVYKITDSKPANQVSV